MKTESVDNLVLVFNIEMVLYHARNDTAADQGSENEAESLYIREGGTDCCLA